MSDIPSEIYSEILLRLPAEPLFRFRTVCKTWRRIIDDPSFVRSHTTNNHRSSPNLLIKPSTGTFYSFSLDSLNYVNGEQTINATRVKNLTRPGVPRILSLPVASCNGLLLISHKLANKTWAIWNPLTADFHELPPPDAIEFVEIGVGIGYDSRSDDYKVVRICRTHNTGKTVDQTSIYSLKSKSWRMIMNCPLNCINPWTRTHGVYFNGAVHWISKRNVIVALDLATEEYRELQSPPVKSVFLKLRLDALDGCLVLSDDGAMRRAWVLRGYGTEQAVWVELFSAMERSVISGLGSSFLRPLAYSNSKRLLIMQHENMIIRWDIGKCCFKKVTIHGLQGSVTSQVIPGSLFRLNGRGSTAAERTAGVKRKRSKTSERFEFTATTIDTKCMPDPVSVPLADRLVVFGGRCHRRLVSLFLQNAKGVLCENGEIHITHKTNGYHWEWTIVSKASSHRLRLIEAVDFILFHYPRYNTKRGFGGNKNFDCQPSKTYKFGLE